MTLPENRPRARDLGITIDYLLQLGAQRRFYKEKTV